MDFWRGLAGRFWVGLCLGFCRCFVGRRVWRLWIRLRLGFKWYAFGIWNVEFARFCGKWFGFWLRFGLSWGVGSIVCLLPWEFGRKPPRIHRNPCRQRASWVWFFPIQWFCFWGLSKCLILDWASWSEDVVDALNRSAALISEVSWHWFALLSYKDCGSVSVPTFGFLVVNL